METADDSRGLILVAEDEVDMRRLLRRRLESAGYEVMEIADGMTLRTHLQAALAGQAGYRLPDLLISDIDMPGLDGLRALEDTPESVGAIPVLFITGMANPPDPARAGAVGACRVIRKPFEFAELLAEVERFIRR